MRVCKLVAYCSRPPTGRWPGGFLEVTGPGRTGAARRPGTGSSPRSARRPRRARSARSHPYRWAAASVRNAPNASWPLARVSTSRYVRPSRKATEARNAPISSRPWYSSGNGGMASHASSLNSATMAATSPARYARVSRSARSRSAARSGGRDRGRAGMSSRRLARARLSALVSDSSVTARMRAASLAGKPSTSRRISAARWRGGSRCTAVMNASDIDFRVPHTWPPALGRRRGARRSKRIRIGLEPGDSPSLVGPGWPGAPGGSAAVPGDGGPIAGR